jgi:hypothetical protein
MKCKIWFKRENYAFFFTTHAHSRKIRVFHWGKMSVCACSRNDEWWDWKNRVRCSFALTHKAWKWNNCFSRLKFITFQSTITTIARPVFIAFELGRLSAMHDTLYTYSFGSWVVCKMYSVGNCDWLAQSLSHLICGAEVYGTHISMNAVNEWIWCIWKRKIYRRRRRTTEAIRCRGDT